MTDLVAGHVKMGSVTWSSALGQIRAGTVVPLAVSSARPMPEFPDVPTMKVLGYPDLVATTWFGFSAPAGVSKEIVSRLNAEIVNALGSPAIRQRLEAKESRPKKCRPRNSPVSSQARSPNGRRWRDRCSIRLRRDSSPGASHSSKGMHLAIR
jgi:tripartite-type tricarboxylate transporter receptor subunit TctC